MRAAHLSSAEKTRIASLGGQARRASLVAARRIEDNFSYLAARDGLRRQPAVTRLKAFAGTLPGIRPVES